MCSTVSNILELFYRVIFNLCPSKFKYKLFIVCSTLYCTFYGVLHTKGSNAQYMLFNTLHTVYFCLVCRKKDEGSLDLFFLLGSSLKVCCSVQWLVCKIYNNQYTTHCTLLWQQNISCSQKKFKRSVDLFLLGVKYQVILWCAVYSVLCSVQYNFKCVVGHIVCSMSYSIQYSVHFCHN